MCACSWMGKYRPGKHTCIYLQMYTFPACLLASHKQNYGTVDIKVVIIIVMAIKYIVSDKRGERERR